MSCLHGKHPTESADGLQMQKSEKTVLTCRYPVNGLIPEFILEQTAVDEKYCNEVFITQLPRIRQVI